MPDAKLGDVGYAIERHAKRNGHSVVREYCGPGKPATGLTLREGMVFTIEPMLNQGRRTVAPRRTAGPSSPWTTSSSPSSSTAFTRDGVRVLTLRP